MIPLIKISDFLKKYYDNKTGYVTQFGFNVLKARIYINKILLNFNCIFIIKKKVFIKITSLGGILKWGMQTYNSKKLIL